MLITGITGNVASVLIDVDDLIVIRQGLESVDPNMFYDRISNLQNNGLLSNEVMYHGVIGQAIVAIEHIQRTLARFKKSEEMKKVLEDAEVTTVN